jgi:hypothetical protein
MEWCPRVAFNLVSLSFDIHFHTLTLLRGDIIWSMVTGTLPRIERPLLTGSEFPDIPPSLLYNADNNLTLIDFGEEIMRLIRFMSELTITQVTLIHTAGATMGEIICFNRLRSAAEHRLLSIRVLAPTQSFGSQMEAAIYESCRISTLMCSNCIFREFLPRAFAIRGLKAALLDALGEIETLGGLENALGFEELLFWVYFVGGMFSLPGDTEWFAIRVARLMSNLELEDWPDVEQSLARCLWTDKMQSTFCLAFWDEVQGIVGGADRDSNHGESVREVSTELGHLPPFGSDNPTVAKAHGPAPQLSPSVTSPPPS